MLASDYRLDSSSSSCDPSVPNLAALGTGVVVAGTAARGVHVGLGHLERLALLAAVLEDDLDGGADVSNVKGWLGLTHSTDLSLIFFSSPKKAVSSSCLEMGWSMPVTPPVALLYCGLVWAWR